MKNLQEILNNINEAVESYELLELVDTNKQSEALRKLTSNLFYLEEHRINAYNDWLTEYYEMPKGTSNAAKEKHCDSTIKELYMIRRIMTGGYRVCDALRSTISTNKKE